MTFIPLYETIWRNILYTTKLMVSSLGTGTCFNSCPPMVCGGLGILDHPGEIHRNVAAAISQGKL
jgi:hypothetical protein